MKKLEFSLIGISGFGSAHLESARRLIKEGIVDLKAVCDVNYEANREIIESLSKDGVKYYSDYREMLEKEDRVDFVAISTPLHLHKNMSIDVMEAGMHVLLEKPPAVTIQDVDAILKKSLETGKYCAIDFLLTSQKSFLQLKELIHENKLGKILSVTGVAPVIRDMNYFNRNKWAGKLTVNGNYVLDGPINNPLAHLLNNMTLLASAYSTVNDDLPEIQSVRAELYHANTIESEDTSCIHARMNNGVDLYYYATLCNDVYSVPYIVVEGSCGKAVWYYNDGLDVTAGDININFRGQRGYELDSVYRNLCSVINGEETDLYCSIKDTRNFILTSNGAFESSGTIHNIPDEYKSKFDNGKSLEVRVDNIGNIIAKAAKEKKLFSEIGVKWAVAGKDFSMKNYNKFSLFMD